MKIFTIILFSFSLIQATAQDSSSEDIIIGKRLTIPSETLNEDREVLVSLPTNYNGNSYNYPIIVVLDADYLFEITRSIVNIKTSRNEMPASIIVGITNNTGKRYDMALQLSNKAGRKFFGNSGGKTKDYLTFFKKELFPFLEKNYRINAHKTIIGLSPTFGPVLEAFWNEPDLFTGYIVLAAELSLTTISGETVAEKTLKSIQNAQHSKRAIYIGKASKDLKRRPPEEAMSFLEINQKLETIINPNINYKIEILEKEDHYGMSVSGIERGLETIYLPEIWNIPYRSFWKSKNPANALKLFYTDLSNQYGFKIVPLEDSFYYSATLLGTVRRLERQGRMKEMSDVLALAKVYYPNSVEINRLLVQYKDRKD